MAQLIDARQIGTEGDCIVIEGECPHCDRTIDFSAIDGHGTIECICGSDVTFDVSDDLTDLDGTQLVSMIADDIREGANPTNATADALRATDRPNTRLLDDVRHMDQLDGRTGEVAAQNALESLSGDAPVTEVIDMLTFETYRWLAIELADV